MLITPGIHCFGLVIVAELISAVHAIPVPASGSTPPSTFMHLEELNSFRAPTLSLSLNPHSLLRCASSSRARYNHWKNHASGSKSPSAAVHPLSKSGHTHSPNSPLSPPPQGSPLHSGLPDPSEWWSTAYRITVSGLAELSHIDQSLKDFDTRPPLKLGALDRNWITNSIVNAIRATKKSNQGSPIEEQPRFDFSGESNRYTNDYPAAADSQVPLTSTKDNMVMLVLEGLEGSCKDRPCAGCVLKSGNFVFTSIYRPDPDRWRGVFRYTNAPHYSTNEWKMFDEQFWDRFPLEKIQEPQWAKVKRDIDRRDKDKIDRLGKAAAASSQKKLATRH
ncbi:hypothetical protein BDP27DRAFT_1428226 [Rhodocollybia butyracea]|uniref:Uncharacterized protein n=1 Tax=Rhodocollybia butyracea TaxID=206335 RepID=A0A9P5PF90_9AGAR|nr:hypothetical protein BDP27DRAFT_1428226 [Rhodocollybia butyracea]